MNYKKMMVLSSSRHQNLARTRNVGTPRANNQPATASSQFGARVAQPPQSGVPGNKPGPAHDDDVPPPPNLQRDTVKPGAFSSIPGRSDVPVSRQDLKAHYANVSDDYVPQPNKIKSPNNTPSPNTESLPVATKITPEQLKMENSRQVAVPYEPSAQETKVRRNLANLFKKNNS